MQCAGGHKIFYWSETFVGGLKVFVGGYSPLPSLPAGYGSDRVTLIMSYNRLLYQLTQMTLNFNINNWLVWTELITYWLMQI